MSLDKQSDWAEGRVQVYTGDGKGKSTAAFGLALRAAGAGLHVFIAQFAKSMPYNEITAFARFPDLIEIRQFGRDGFIIGTATQEDINAAQHGLCEVRKIFAAGTHRIVILDEANIAVHFQMFTIDELLDLVAVKPPEVELVITGRRADPRLIERADLVTEMREIKHYYHNGVEARKGIES